MSGLGLAAAVLLPVKAALALALVAGWKSAPTATPEGRRLRWWERGFEALGWHKPGPVVRFTMASANGQRRWCQRCGRSLLLDSQGNWFPVSE